MYFFSKGFRYFPSPITATGFPIIPIQVQFATIHSVRQIKRKQKRIKQIQLQDPFKGAQTRNVRRINLCFLGSKR